jgi:long-chain acyl-CoA synthetase
VAFVQPAAGRRLEEAELRAYLKENLAPYKVPAEIVIAELPIGPTGKILKSALRDSVAGGGAP